MLNKILAYAYAAAGVIACGFLVQGEVVRPSLSDHGEVELGMFLIAGILLLIGVLILRYVIKTHWKLYKFPLDTKSSKALKIFSVINLCVAILIVVTDNSCTDSGCIFVALWALILAATFLVTLILCAIVRKQIR